MVARGPAGSAASLPAVVAQERNPGSAAPHRSKEWTRALGGDRAPSTANVARRRAAARSAPVRFDEGCVGLARQECRVRHQPLEEKERWCARPRISVRASAACSRRAASSRLSPQAMSFPIIES